MENKPVLVDNWVLPLSSTLTLSFVQRSISGVASRPAKYFDPSGTGYHIAVHFRRGEVSPTIMEMQRYRWLDNAGYINMVQKVLALLPDAEVHIFSTTIDDVTKKQMFASADFHTFRQLGYQVHLDGAAMDVLVHMSKADVLIRHQSSFAMAAAFLNPKCILSTRSSRESNIEIPGVHLIYDDALSNQTTTALRHCQIGIT